MGFWPVVEDMIETGRGLKLAKEHLESKGASVRTASLYTMPFTEFQPDFQVREIMYVEHFPWEVEEIMVKH